MDRKLNSTDPIARGCNLFEKDTYNGAYLPKVKYCLRCPIPNCAPRCLPRCCLVKDLLGLGSLFAWMGRANFETPHHQEDNCFHKFHGICCSLCYYM